MLAAPYELGYHGVDAAAAEEIFHETLDALRAAWAAERLTTRRYDGVPLPLRPLQRPQPPLWYPTATPEKAAWAASEGMRVMGLGPVERFAACAQRFRRAWARDDAGATLGMMRQIVVAPSDDEGIAIARAAHPRFAETFMTLWEAHGDRRPRALVNLDAALEHNTLLAGTPDTVGAELARQAASTDLDYFALAFAWGDLTFEHSLRSLRLFADHVARQVAPPERGHRTRAWGA
jgi:alkanesulfonate monooxygenase SsuD/methylene tetrahydromethanopterin reductase-like flavin-dependent oxidoreductase (luciferase family)